MMRIVVRDGCKYCDEAISLIESKGDNYEVLNLSTQEEVKLYRFLGHTTVPHIVGVGGYTDLVKYYHGD